MFDLTISDTFNAAHQLRGYDGPCENLHGHTWKVEITACGRELDRLGLAVDFKQLKTLLRLRLDELDHKNLNDLKPFSSANPTCENVAKYIYEKLKADFKGGFALSKVTVYESERASAAYYE